MYDGHTDAVPHIPSWLVFDQRYRDSYVFAGLPPGKPLPRRWFAAGAVHGAAALGELAAGAGLDPAALAATVARFGEFAAAGATIGPAMTFGYIAALDLTAAP